MRIGTVIRGYDLRTPLEVKIEDACDYGWTVFINNSHRLMHITKKKSAIPFLVRWKLSNSLKNYSTDYIINLVQKGLGHDLR